MMVSVVIAISWWEEDLRAGLADGRSGETGAAGAGLGERQHLGQGPSRRAVRRAARAPVTAAVIAVDADAAAAVVRQRAIIIPQPGAGANGQ